MLIRCLAFAKKATQLAVIATLLWVGHNAGFSDEPVQSSKEKKVEKPSNVPEKKNLLNFRAYRPSDSVLKSPSIDVPFPPVSPLTPSTRTSKENRELLDRQKNWIFVLPGDEEKSESTVDLLGMDALTLDNGSKSVLTKFLENKQSVDQISTEANNKAINKNDSKNFAGPQIFGLGNEKRNGLGAGSQPVTKPENSVGGSGAPLSLSERWQEMHGPKAEKAREEKRVRMNEFENLFNSQSSVAGNGGLTTLQNNFGLQPATPASGLDSFNRNAPASSGLRNPVRPLSGASSSAQPSINTRVFGSTTTVAPTPEAPRTVTQPAVLPIPKRRF